MPPARATTSHSSGAPSSPARLNGVVKMHRQRLPRRAGRGDQVAVGDLAAPDDPRPRVVGRDDGSSRLRRRQREAAEHQQPPRARLRRRRRSRLGRRREPLEHARGAGASAVRGASAMLTEPRAAATPGAGSTVRSTCSPGVPHTARPRSSAAIGSVGGVRQILRAALEQHPVAGDEQRAWRRASSRRPRRSARRRPERVEAGGAERGQQVVAGGAGEAGEREALEDAIEAALRRPDRLARERVFLRAGARDPGAVGGAVRALASGSASRSASSQRGRVSSISVLQLGREREQERQPGRLLEVGLSAIDRVRAGRVQPDLAPASARRPGVRHRRSPSGPGRAGCGSRRRRRAGAGG